MKLYSGSTAQLFEDTARNQIAGKLVQAFLTHFGRRPGDAEIASWQNSLRALTLTFQRSKLNDHGVLLEYKLPLTSKRLDCLICGHDQPGRQQAVIIELKQWDSCEESYGENLMQTWVGGAIRDVLHPSAQALGYRQFLEDGHTAFHEGEMPVSLSACAFLHNYTPVANDTLYLPRYEQVLSEAPSFSASHAEELSEFLESRLRGGDGMPVLQRIEEGKYRASKKLMEHVARVIQGLPQYVLLDEQQIVHSKVLALAKRGFHDARKTVVIVQGGPGTGKSVIALNLMSSLMGSGYNSHYATGSKAFTETLRNVVGKRSSAQFKYFNSYAEAEVDAIDVLICDESHRIRTTSVDRFTPKDRRSGLPQVDELIRASKVSLFFVDDRQAVRPGEIGSSGYIRAAAEAQICQVLDYELHAQFRCAGSDAFLEWLNNTLGIERTASTLLQASEGFDFRIVESPEELERLILERARGGESARLTAGFCWPWSDPDKHDHLANDVVIGNFARPWNAKSSAGRLAPGIPKENLWANDPGGLHQIGCVYTAQGFEFDYVGVIFGTDLTYDLDRQAWVGNPAASKDKAVKRADGDFISLVKNTYRVLLSRGLKGCYVHFLDKDTERFFRSRIGTPFEEIEGAAEAQKQTHRLATEAKPSKRPLPFERVPLEQLRPFENALPVFDIRAAAGGFTEFQALTLSTESGLEGLGAIDWVAIPDDFRTGPGRFLMQVVGESMNRRIPNGSWCLFRASPAGDRGGKVVLAELRDMADPELGGRYTVKLYRSEKAASEDGEWSHERIVLSPDSDRGGYEAIEFAPEDEGKVRIVAELVAVVPTEKP